jgi:ferredoxin
MGLVYLSNVSTLALDQEKCVGCGSCLPVCPHQILFLDDGKIACLDHDACMECGACAMNCPTGAVSVEAGVGCAAAVIASALSGGKQVCC